MKKSGWKAGTDYYRNLPHLQPENSVFFVTPTLSGALPRHIIETLQLEKELKIAEFRKSNISDDQLKKALAQQRNLYFSKFDHLLDNPKSGPTHLGNPQVAQMLYDCLLHFDHVRYKMVCFTIMNNHAHLVIHKLDRKLFQIMHSIKTFSGRKGNKILNQIGLQFWQAESYDRWIRNKQEFKHWVTYTLNNPIKAGLVKNWRDWDYAYIHPDYEQFILDWVNDEIGPSRF